MEAEHGRKIATGAKSRSLWSLEQRYSETLPKTLEEVAKYFINDPTVEKSLFLSTFKLQIDENHSVKDVFHCY